jgi:hypothetical protein
MLQLLGSLEELELEEKSLAFYNECVIRLAMRPQGKSEHSQDKVDLLKAQKSW